MFTIYFYVEHKYLYILSNWRIVLKLFIEEKLRII